MDMVRIFFDETGVPAGVEARPDQEYIEDSIADHLRSYRSEVMPADRAKSLLQRHDVNISGPANDAAARLREIRDTDKSALADDDWLSLYREYVTLNGGF